MLESVTILIPVLLPEIRVYIQETIHLATDT